MSFPSHSSHFKRWILSEVEICRLKEEANLRGRQSVLTKLEIQGRAECFKSLVFPTASDTENLISYFVSQLIFVCSEKRFDYRLTNTAAALLARFYLKRSILEYDPRRTLLTCILLAAKIEESMGTTLRHFCEGLIPSKDKLAEVVAGELAVLEAIDFELLILSSRAPIHYLTTLFFHQNRSTKSEEANTDLGKQLADINRQAEMLATKTYTRPEITFSYSPAQIGVAAFLQVSTGVLANVDQFISALFKKDLEKIKLGEALGPRLQELRVKLALMTEDDMRVTEENKQLQALKTIKKLDKINKTLAPTAKKNKRGKTQVSAEGKDDTPESIALPRAEQATKTEMISVETSKIGMTVTDIKQEYGLDDRELTAKKRRTES